MQKFKISVLKQGKKFTFVLSAENEIQAKNRIHKE
jgi:phosphoribosylformylglycinamidine (FGAM) synthase PurS component